MTMSMMAPDYGMKLLRGGAYKTVLDPLTLNMVGRLPNGAWCVTSYLMVDGVRHAVTVDFAGGVLTQLKALIGGKNAEHIEAAMAIRGGVPACLCDVLAFRVTARLGKPQANLHEKYVPLVALTVAPTSSVEIEGPSPVGRPG